MSDKSKTIEWGASWVSDEEEYPSVNFTFEPDGLDNFTSVSVFCPEYGDIPFMEKVSLIKKWVIDMEEMHNENKGAH
jgi:hypothetical protein